MDEPRETPAVPADDAPASPELPLPDYALPPLFHDPIHEGVFVGAEGLRVPWRFVSYVLIAGAIAYLLFLPLPFLRAHGVIGLWASLVTELDLLIAVLVPAFLMAHVEQRPFGTYGLPRRAAFGKLFWVGVLWGLLSLTILMLAMRGAGVFYFGGIALHGVRILKFAVFWAGFFLIVGFFEEFLMRGYTQFTLTQGIGFWPSAVLLSIAFGAIHLGNSGEAWNGVVAAGLIGFFFCLTLRRTGNLWFAVGFHMSWDWGETYLYSVPNSGITPPGHLLSSTFHGSRWLSGGSVGPEGSVFVFLVLALLWAAFDRAYPQVKYGPEAPPRHGDTEHSTLVSP